MLHRLRRRRGAPFEISSDEEPLMRQKRGSTDCRSGARRHTDRVQFCDSSRKPDGTS